MEKRVMGVCGLMLAVCCFRVSTKRIKKGAPVFLSVYKNEASRIQISQKNHETVWNPKDIQKKR